MAKVTFISLGTPDPEQRGEFKTYVEATPRIFLAAGGVPIKRVNVVETLLGEEAPETVFLMEFPSADAVKTVLASEEYKRLIPHRDKAFKKLTFLLAEAF